MIFLSRQAGPFLKWAGGKSQLIRQISRHLPQNFADNVTTYVEPFLGGGALLFYLLQNYRFERVVVNDINSELILTYKTIQKSVGRLIAILSGLESDYLALSMEDRAKYYYEIREAFNEEKKSHTGRGNAKADLAIASKFIFLNKTCYNGLYRLNLKGEFNVPAGAYRRPAICNAENLVACSSVLQNVRFLSKDFVKLSRYIDDHTFVYMDPPYRPLSNTSSFNSYQKSPFNDDAQRRLARWYGRLNEAHAFLALSNSDPKNFDENDDFFDELYAEYNIKRVSASRTINSDTSKRGSIHELLILNYDA